MKLELLVTRFVIKLQLLFVFFVIYRYFFHFPMYAGVFFKYYT